MVWRTAFLSNFKPPVLISLLSTMPPREGMSSSVVSGDIHNQDTLGIFYVDVHAEAVRNCLFHDHDLACLDVRILDQIIKRALSPLP